MGRKKGGKGKGNAADGGGGPPGDRSTQPESQPSLSQGGKGRGGGDTQGDRSKQSEPQPSPSQVSGAGDAPYQKNVGGKSQPQEKTGDGRQQPRDRPQQQLSQGPPGFQQPQRPQQPSGFGQQQFPTVAHQAQPSSFEKPRGPPQQQQHSQRPSASGTTWGPPQQQQYPQQSSSFQQHRGPTQPQQYHQKPPGFQPHSGPPPQQQYPQKPPGLGQPRGPTQQQQYQQQSSGFQPHSGPPQQQQYPQKPPGSTQPRGPSQQHQHRQKPQDPSQQTTKPETSRLASQESVSRKGAGDKTIEKFTPRAIVSLQEQMAQTSLKGTKFRPGTKGRKIPIETNYLNLNLGKLKVAYHYDIDINPDIPKKFLRDVAEAFRKKHFPKYHPAFDGRKNLYSPFELVKEGAELSDEIKIMDPMNGREKIFKVKVQFANTVDLTPLHNIRMTTLSPQEAIQCVEIVLRSAPSSRCIPAGRSFFTRPPQIIDLGEGMEMYQGFYQSVVRGWKPLLNVDVAHKAFPKEIDLVALSIELCSSYYQQLTENDLRTKGMSDDQKKTLEKFLRSLRVVYEIRGQPGSKREYRVNGIKECPQRYKFRPDNGAEMTIEEYFARKKNYRLQYPLMPTIWVGNAQRTDPILLPAELCTLVAGQAVNRKMTENQTSAMIKRAATSTDVRKDKIMRSLQQTRHNEDLCIREFGFSIGNGFEQIQARVLDPPCLEYFNSASVQPSKGVWRADNLNFLKGAHIKSWTIISACGPMDNMARLADMIYSFGPKCGMTLMSKAEPPFESIRGRQPRFGDILACLEKCSKKGYDLVFVIIPDSGPTYSDVKRAAELSIGCLTQCIKRNTLFKKLNPATVNNILLKVNSKLNGTNHCLRTRPQILSVPCMIMGADVTHPSPESQNIPSVAAVTASHDPKAFCYNICCRLQSPKTEIITDLQAITREHLMYFHKVNKGQKPQRIIFFRDGVSEGQFNDVLAQEVRAIRNACTSLEKDYNPKITFLVVQKRHHTRFFPRNKRDSEDKNCNVPAGTCVDTDITNPNLQDFYLVSHASIQGVAKPTKYCTLWDDNDLDHDEIEALTYHLCHLFSRCNRSVSYPAPTYYAHLAAARAKVYIENIDLDLNRLDIEQRKINILDVIRKNKPMFFV